MTSGARQTGDFCWINILTPSVDSAREFFHELLGWSYEAVEGAGHIILVNGRRIGGIFASDGVGMPAGTHPHISVVLKVDDASHAARRVSMLGGLSRSPFDIPDQGRMSVCHDSNGAAFDVWETTTMSGIEANSTLHGVPSWFEAVTTDVARATDFYCDLFGWSASAYTGGPVAYTTFALDGRPIAGMLSINDIPPHDVPVLPHWGTYFTVDDAAAVVAKAVALGANNSVPLMTIAGGARIAGFESPHGVPFYVIEYAR
ncbi:MAG: VOC family protein [Gemmatimonadaceae bacterium]